MYGVEILESNGPSKLRLVVIDERQIEEMKQNGTLKAAIDDLKAKLEFHRRKVQEIENALEALKSVSGDEGDYSTAVMHNKEFVRSGIAEAAATLIKRTQRPLHVQEIADALQAGGYVFKTDNPVGSVGPVLYQAADKGAYGLVRKPKNTYSIAEIEAKNAA